MLPNGGMEGHGGHGGTGNEPASPASNEWIPMRRRARAGGSAACPLVCGPRSMLDVRCSMFDVPPTRRSMVRGPVVSWSFFSISVFQHFSFSAFAPRRSSGFSFVRVLRCEPRGRANYGLGRSGDQRRSGVVRCGTFLQRAPSAPPPWRSIPDATLPKLRCLAQRRRGAEC